jgi:hypothetical protein
LKRLFSVRMSIFEKHKQCLDCPWDSVDDKSKRL